MPKVTVEKPFTFREGGKVKLYKQGEQELTAAALAHAQANGFSPKPASTKAKPAAEAK